MEQLNPGIRKDLEQFFSQQETSAYKMAYALTHNRDDALELVQDSMLKLVQHYAHKPQEQWCLLFYRILQNRIKDFHRRQKVSRLFNLFTSTEDDSQHQLEQAPDLKQETPQQNMEQHHALERILGALKRLPVRQQQTFILRAWQEFSVKETAFTLSISEGSVKTHYNRAQMQLRKLLGAQHESL